MASEVKRWRHSRKGIVIGREVWRDDTWMKVELAEDHELRYMAESNRGRVDEAGAVETFRISLMTALAGKDKDDDE